jgi:hypothetical protein
MKDRLQLPLNITFACFLSLCLISARPVAATPTDSAQAEPSPTEAESVDDDSPLFHHSLGGRFLLYTLQGEYELLWNKSNGVRFGLEGWIYFGGMGGLRGTVSYRHFLLSSQDKRHHLELGIGPSINLPMVDCYVDANDCEPMNPIALHLGLNYRFQAFNGFLFRFGIEPDIFIFDLNSLTPIFPNMIGMIGYSF